MKKLKLFIFCSLLSSFSLAAAETKSFKSQHHDFKFEILTQQSDVIWGFDFLSPNEIIFTERSGKIKILDLTTKKISEVSGGPNVFAKGQGGLLDIRVQDPKKKVIYLSYSEAVNDLSTTSLACAELVGTELKNLKRIFTAKPATDSKIHYGSRIEFDNTGLLYLSVGERNERKQVQNLGSHLGKIMRLKLDGTAAVGNPYEKDNKSLPEVWSYGHRNPQGLTLDPSGKNLWVAEMGPRGGDEVNLVEPGKNYGWPDVTYGREYYGLKIGPPTKEGITNPTVYWVPSISPSGINFYTGAKFSKWTGDLFAATLSGQHLRRLKIKGNTVIEQEELLVSEKLRFRHVRSGPDNFLYVSTDEGHIARLSP
jgi:glucose/arabinose dehydrogenase